MTSAYSMRIVINLPALQRARQDYDPRPRTDLIIAGGKARYGLGTTHWNLLDDSGWERELPYESPLFADLLEVGALAVDAGTARITTITAGGLSLALGKTMAFCDARWTAIGETAPAAAAAVLDGLRTGDFLDTPVAQTATPLLAVADAFVRRGCSGSYTTEDGYLLRGNIDGDGVEDILIDWNYVRCSAGLGRPFCGASNCSGSAFLSRLYPTKGRPEDFLGSVFALPQLSNGMQGISFVMSGGGCFENPKSCEFLFYWNGNDLIRLPN